jgi:hypothetical protein
MENDFSYSVVGRRDDGEVKLYSKHLLLTEAKKELREKRLEIAANGWSTFTMKPVGTIIGGFRCYSFTNAYTYTIERESK